MQPRINRPSLLSVQHNYESQDGDHRNQEMQDATANSATAASTLSVPAIRRVHSYSGASSGEGTNEGSVNRDHEMTARRTMSALEPTFNFASSTSVGRSVSMHAITSSAANPATATPFESGLVGPSIPLALRRASSDHQHIPGEIRDAATSGMQGKSGFHMGLDSPASFTSGWPSSSSLRMTSTAKTPTTPPKATTFNPGSPSNASTGLGMMTTPVRSSIGLRARANSGTRMRGPGGTFGTPSTGVPSSDTRKRSGSGSGNAASAGPWHARANVSVDAKWLDVTLSHLRRASLVNYHCRRPFARLLRRTKIFRVPKSDLKACFSASSFPIQSHCQ